MPVRAYVTRDKEKKEWPPVHSHEVTGAVSLLQRLHAAFCDEPQEYAVITNLRSPQADLVVITELGVGVVELKHNVGRLTVRGATWETEHGPIKAGSEPKGYANPREQVQSYADTIRERLLPKCAAWWSLMEHNLRKKMRVQSAVCFTHPQLTISDEARTAIVRAAGAEYSRRGRFDLLAPNDFPGWVVALRFEMVENREHQYQPYRLGPRQIAELISEFHAVEWTTIHALMPSDQAYAYLIIRDERQESQVFSLHTLELQIGRSASNCALIVPRGHGKVSRVHAQINRYGDQVWLQDLESSHGTYINGVRIGQAAMLKPGDCITLGGPASGPGVYSCEFTRKLPDDVQATETFKERF